MMRSTLILLLVWAAAGLPTLGAPDNSPPTLIHVDPARGKDRNPGSRARPLKTISSALLLLPELLKQSITIQLAAGTYAGTGSDEMPGNELQLMRRMRPGVTVQLVGTLVDGQAATILAWEGGSSMIDVREGDWQLQDLVVGSNSTLQRRGVLVAGPAQLTLQDVSIRCRSFSGAGIMAHRAGRITLKGRIRLNEQLHDLAEDETFCGIVATEYGTVKFEQREGASLDMGNGSLSASYYGCIRLGCETARITSWGRQSNNLAVNNGGRIDLHETTLTLRAAHPENTPIGPEHDGHILGEDAHVILLGKNDTAIALQKASTFTCNDIELRGEFKKSVWALSGSMFVGRFLTDVTRLEAHTGATVHIEAIKGELKGPVVATSGALISLPDGSVIGQKR